METLFTGLRWIHVAAGFIGLAAFWVPILTRKGGSHHRWFGKVFKYCAYLVLGAAMLSVTLHMSQALSAGVGPNTEPNGFAFLVFLGYLALVTFIGLRHGILVLQHKPGLDGLDTPVNRLLARAAIASSILLIAYAVYFRPDIIIVLLALSPIGFSTGKGILKAIGGQRPESKAWFYEHMGSMIGTGIAFHTAFAVFGSRTLWNLGLEGWVAIIPWILPALIGIPAVTLWTRHYMRKFGDLPA